MSCCRAVGSPCPPHADSKPPLVNPPDPPRGSDGVHRTLTTQRLCAPGGALDPAVCERRWAELVEEVAPSLPAEFARWADRETLDGWQTRQTQIAEHYLPHRTAILLQQLVARGHIDLDSDGLTVAP